MDIDLAANFDDQVVVYGYLVHVEVHDDPLPYSPFVLTIT
jgi:hypothetical protein